MEGSSEVIDSTHMTLCLRSKRSSVQVGPGVPLFNGLQPPPTHQSVCLPLANGHLTADELRMAAASPISHRAGGAR